MAIADDMHMRRRVIARADHDPQAPEPKLLPPSLGMASWNQLDFREFGVRNCRHDCLCCGAHRDVSTCRFPAEIKSNRTWQTNAYHRIVATRFEKRIKELSRIGS